MYIKLNFNSKQLILAHYYISLNISFKYILVKFLWLFFPSLNIICTAVLFYQYMNSFFLFNPQGIGFYPYFLTLLENIPSSQKLKTPKFKSRE